MLNREEYKCSTNSASFFNCRVGSTDAINKRKILFVIVSHLAWETFPGFLLSNFWRHSSGRFFLSMIKSLSRTSVKVLYILIYSTTGNFWQSINLLLIGPLNDFGPPTTIKRSREVIYLYEVYKSLLVPCDLKYFNIIQFFH